VTRVSRIHLNYRFYCTFLTSLAFLALFSSAALLSSGIFLHFILAPSRKTTSIDANLSASHERKYALVLLPLALDSTLRRGVLSLGHAQLQLAPPLQCRPAFYTLLLPPSSLSVYVCVCARLCMTGYEFFMG